jgi:hypothetical protein
MIHLHFFNLVIMANIKPKSARLHGPEHQPIKTRTTKHMGSFQWPIRPVHRPIYNKKKIYKTTALISIPGTTRN